MTKYEIIHIKLKWH